MSQQGVAPPAPSPTVNRRRVLTFVGVTYAVDWGAVGALQLAGVPFSGMIGAIVAGGYMIVPAVVAIALARRWRISLHDLGVRLPRNWYIATAAVLPLLVAILTIAVAVLLGFGEFDATGMGIVERWKKPVSGSWPMR